ncbi:MAG: shikimate kinase [bacterium]
MNIVLTGFMGTGKSLVGKKLAKRLKMSYLDTDELIEKREAAKISRIFQEKGEQYFRTVETKIIKEVSGLDRCVISTGGGAILKAENLVALKRKGVIICLSANPKVILKRTSKSQNRPLLKSKDRERKVFHLLKTRRSFYDKADFEVDTSELTTTEVVERIEDFLRKKSGDSYG